MRVLRGLGALVLLTGLLIGAPWLLLVAGRLPDPGELTGAALWQTLTGVDDGSLVLVALTLLGWVAWLVLVASTAAELVALVARRPVRLPGLGMPQHLVRTLLVAVLALAVTPQVAGGAHAAPGSHAGHRPSAPVAPQAPVSAPIEQEVPEGALVHRVVAGDDLWSLAERYYGEGTSWRLIAEANPALLTGGADHLEAGWRLVVPGARPPATESAPDEGPGGGSVRVRAGDTLASLSAQHLGGAGRWPELHAANLSTVPDPDRLQVGQVIRLPPGAGAGGVAAGTEPRRPSDRTPARGPDGSDGDAGHDGPRGGRTQEPSGRQGAEPGPGEDAREDTERGPVEDTRAPQGAGADGSEPSGEEDPAGTPEGAGSAQGAPPPANGPAEDGAVALSDQELDRLARVGVVGSTGGLLAAAVVAGLAHRRSVQLAGRPPGRGLAVPSPPAQRVRSALTQHQDPLTLEHLVTVQHLIARHCAELGVPVPALEQVGAGEDRISVSHRGAGLPAPAGFDVRTELVPDPAGGPAVPVTTWSFGRQDWEQVRQPVDPDGSVAWPGLVSLGRQHGTSVLVCLQQLGLTALESEDPELGMSAFAALLLELGCSGWSGGVAVTLVGPAGRDVAAAADLVHLTTADHLDQVLARLEHRSREQRAQQAHPALRRLDPTADTAWDPEVLLVSQPVVPDQWARLQRLVTAGAPVAAVVLAPTDDVPAGVSRLLVRGEGAELRRPTSPVLSFVPQLVGPEVRAALAELLEVTARTSTVPAPWWAPPPDPAGSEHARADHRRADDATVVRLPTRVTGWKETSHVSSPAGEALSTGAGPTLLLVGPVELVGARGTAPTRAVKQCMEYCAWLLENPGRTAVAMAASLLVAEGTRRSNMSRLRTWLGVDEDGEPYLPDAYSGRILLHPAVGSDWDEVRVLVAGGVANARTETLVAALRLVRGAPLADAAPHQWGWAEELRVEMLCTIRDIALVVCDRALADGDLDLARWAAARGLTVGPDDERLLVARLRTEHQAGNRAEVERLARRLTRSARVLGVDLDDETVQVLQQVLEGRVRAREV